MIAFAIWSTVLMAAVLKPSAASELLSVCNCAWLASVPAVAAVVAPIALAPFVAEAAVAGCCVVATGATFAALAFPFVPARTPATATASVAAAGVAAAGAGVVVIV